MFCLHHMVFGIEEIKHPLQALEKISYMWMDGWTSPYSLEWSNKHVLLFCVPNTHSYKIRMFLIPLFSIYSCVLFFSSVLHSSIPNRPKEDCTKASSHKLILGWKRAFALRITRANFFLKTDLHLWT